jgi:DNA-binding transcriptional ArsR family regulator
MVVHQNLSEAEFDQLFGALADSTRRDILRRTAAGEQSVSELARRYRMSYAAVQKHVAVLASAQLVTKRAEGRERRIRANPTRIARARALLGDYESLWRSRVNRLDDVLSDDAAEAEDSTDFPTTQPGA